MYTKIIGKLNIANLGYKYRRFIVENLVYDILGTLIVDYLNMS